MVPILERVRGFEAAMKKYPDIKIVTKQNGKQERDTALTVTENMLQSAPDLAGIFSVNDVGALGALAAIESNGAKVKLVSVDGQPEAIKEILAELAVHRHLGAVPARPAAHRARHCAGPLLGRHGAENRAGQSEADRPQQCGRL